MNNKKRYQLLCQKEETIPVFCEPWWLDTVCGKDKWDVIVINDKESRIEASLPYFLPNPQKITMPAFTQTMGPWIRKGRGNYSTELSRKQRLMKEIIKKLPQVSQFAQNFHYSITDWLPFYWEGFKQTTRYSYVISDISNTNAIYNKFSGKTRGAIRKAEMKNNLSVATDLPDNLFFDHYHKTYERQNIKAPNRNVLSEIIKSGRDTGKVKTFFAKDPHNNIHSIGLFVWNRFSGYYLFGSADSNLRNSGAQSLLLWKMIQFAAKTTTRFDFEGSMIQGIENSFRKFGGQQLSYFRITKDNRTIATKATMFIQQKIKELHT